MSKVRKLFVISIKCINGDEGYLGRFYSWQRYTFTKDFEKARIFKRKSDVTACLNNIKVSIKNLDKHKINCNKQNDLRDFQLFGIKECYMVLKEDV